jgi:hypothetical protein
MDHKPKEASQILGEWYCECSDRRFENTLSFSSEETSLGYGLPFSIWEIYHASLALLTVFPTTQSDHTIAQLVC